VLHHVFQVFEIEQQSGLVEFRAGKSHTDLVVVAVRVLALALVVAQVVSCGEVSSTVTSNMKSNASAVVYCTF